MASLSQFPVLPQSQYIMNSISSAAATNNRQNIISGPGLANWFHYDSLGAAPMIREEGAFPPQGNIGELVKNESYNYGQCGVSAGVPAVGGSPNCTPAFYQDIYTVADTCGANCQLKNPESYGEKDFGFDGLDPAQKITNAHQIHEYQNQRASGIGQGPTGLFTPLEYIPRITTSPQTNVGVYNPQEIYGQVGPWYQLPENADLVYGKFYTGPV